MKNITEMRRIVILTFLFCVAVVLLIILNGCASYDQKTLENTNVIGVLVTPSGWSDVLILRDENNHVTCYYGDNGISCVPD